MFFRETNTPHRSTPIAQGTTCWRWSKSGANVGEVPVFQQEIIHIIRVDHIASPVIFLGSQGATSVFYFPTKWGEKKNHQNLQSSQGSWRIGGFFCSQFVFVNLFFCPENLCFFLFSNLRCSNARQIRQSTEGDQMGSALLDGGTSRITCGAPLMSLVNLVNSDGSLNCLQMMRKWMSTDCISPNQSTPVKSKRFVREFPTKWIKHFKFSMQVFP